MLEPLIVILDRIEKLKIAVLGDVILDEYFFGEVERISPEAPIPIFSFEKRTENLGGACNVALNFREFDIDTYIFGVIGNDDRGERLANLLEKRGINTEGLVIDSGRPTTVKTRIVSQGQQLLRIDRERTVPLPSRVGDELIDRFKRWVSEFDAVVIEDYNKGVMTPGIIRNIIGLSRDLFKAVDPKFENFRYYKNVELLKPNLKELQAVTARRFNNEEEIIEASRNIKKEMNINTVVVTMGKDGLLAIDDDRVIRVPALRREVYDVTGAGDTAIAMLTLGNILKLSREETMILSSVASGLEVGKFGAVPITPDELKSVKTEEWESVRKGVTVRILKNN